MRFTDHYINEDNELIDLQNQVNNSKDVDEFLKNIITDFDLRYKNRKAANPLVKMLSIKHIDDIKPPQEIERKTVQMWEEMIVDGKRPFIIIRTNNDIDGHHKLQAYKNLSFTHVPVVYETDLIDFYNETKDNK